MTPFRLSPQTVLFQLFASCITSHAAPDSLSAAYSASGFNLIPASILFHIILLIYPESNTIALSIPKSLFYATHSDFRCASPALHVLPTPKMMLLNHARSHKAPLQIVGAVVFVTVLISLLYNHLDFYQTPSRYNLFSK